MVQTHAETSRDQFPPWSFSETRLSVGFERVTGYPEPEVPVMNCGGKVGTRTRDLLRDRQEDILAVNEALPS